MRGLIEKEPAKRPFRLSKLISLVTVLSLFCYTYYQRDKFEEDIDDDLCPIHPIKVPESFIIDNSTVLRILHDEDFRLASVKKLSGAVQVDTQVYDDPPKVDDDPEYWAEFANLHKYLQKTFPTVYENVEVIKVNTYGLVFHWKGSNEDLKPVMLMAHQDVVPIQKDTLGDWTYPPLEGHYDGKSVFGRGSSDCKNVLIAIMETLELLIDDNFEPVRGIIAAFGFDEEVSGKKGAYEISQYLQKRFGPKSIYAILDEGSSISEDPATGLIMAGPAVAEKGFLNVNAKLKTKGGHASIPPNHTSIGIVSELITLLEKNPFEPILTSKNPMLEYYQCIAKYGGDKVPPKLRKSIFRAGYDKVANSNLIQYLSQNPLSHYLITTSQAIDIIRGGEKVNALPEFTEFFVNYRLSVETSVKEAMDRFVDLTKVVAEKHGLAVEYKGEYIYGDENSVGTFYVNYADDALEPSPVASSKDKVWEYLAGASRHLIEDLILPDLEHPVVVSPALMPANTDTRHYHNLTDNAFRYTPTLDSDILHKAHSVDEFYPMDQHLQLITFFYEYVQIINTPDASNVE